MQQMLFGAQQLMQQMMQQVALRFEHLLQRKCA